MPSSAQGASPTTGPTASAVLQRLAGMASEDNRRGMARYGITVSRAYGVPLEALRGIAKELGTDHALAGDLWSTGVREARVLAFLIDDPHQVTEGQMERWARDFDSWDVCDGACLHLFSRTPLLAHRKAAAWSARTEEFVKRAAFTLMAILAVHDKKADDATFLAWLPLIAQGARDDRNYVRKAVSWALRQIGKRNPALNEAAVATARELRALDSRSARWVASDALRELESEKVQARLRQKRTAGSARHVNAGNGA